MCTCTCTYMYTCEGFTLRADSNDQLPSLNQLDSLIIDSASAIGSILHCFTPFDADAFSNFIYSIKKGGYTVVIGLSTFCTRRFLRRNWTIQRLSHSPPKTLSKAGDMRVRVRYQKLNPVLLLFRIWNKYVVLHILCADFMWCLFYVV